MHFGENQLSRSLIGLSPLPTAHPPGFQPWWVRASTTSYCCFTLAMGRSPRFGSRPRDSNALFGLAFATAPPHGLTSPRSTDSQAHSSKGTPSPITALTACRHTVSGTLSLPSRGTFHLSLTVLVRYRSPGSIQAYRVVPADSQQIPRARCYLGTPSRGDGFSRTGLSPSTARCSKTAPLTTPLSNSPPIRQNRLTGPTTPLTQPLPGITRQRFSLIRFRSPLLTESRLFSLPTGTEMFHFPAFPPHTL